MENRRVLEGIVILNADSKPTSLRYFIETNSSWQTRRVFIDGYVGREKVLLNLKVNSKRQWLLNGKNVPSVEGCIDIDLGFSPSTNLLPIRRLGLRIGEKAEVSAAWVEFPSMKVKALPQSYSRLRKGVYHYESSGGRFKRNLLVDKEGFVTKYPGIWQMEAFA
jgi:uncharacterized protein